MEKKPKKELEKLLAYENANLECQKAIPPICETGTIIDYLKACCNLGSETQKTQMLAETMVAALRKVNEGCFTCGDKNHLKRTALRKLRKNLQKSALPAVEECIGPKIVNLNLILKENLFQETTGRGPPRSPSTKTRGKFYLFPQTLNITAVDIPALNDFFLYPQAVPSKIPTGLFGPLPPQTFSLLLGQSSLTSKRITIHPGIIDSDYKGQIQIMMSLQIL